MNKKGLAILLRARMRPADPTRTSSISLSPLTSGVNQMVSNSQAGHVSGHPSAERSNNFNGSTFKERNSDIVRESMHSAISMNKTEVLDTVLDDFSEGYLSLSRENRRRLLLILAKEYDPNRMQVRELMKQYLGLQLPSGQSSSHDQEGMLSSFYRIERHLRQALKPSHGVLFDRLNTHPGGLKFLSILRADILSFLEEENIPSLRALDSYLKEKLSTWLSPAALQLHQITWDDPASLLEKIVAYETFATLSPIPGFMQWLLSKLASQSVLAEVVNVSQSSAGGSGSTFQENLLEPDEEELLMSCTKSIPAGKNGMEVMLNLLALPNFEWTKSPKLLSALKSCLMRLCARYLLQEKKRGKALDSVANFHLQNGAMIERINWMADRSEKGLRQSGGIMVNYVYRVENIEEYAHSYFSTGHMHASLDVQCYLMEEQETTAD